MKIVELIGSLVKDSHRTKEERGWAILKMIFWSPVVRLKVVESEVNLKHLKDTSNLRWIKFHDLPQWFSPIALLFVLIILMMALTDGGGDEVKKVWKNLIQPQTSYFKLKQGEQYKYWKLFIN